jgi:bifunctional oligoribonuclease and PAP phosphatase NrnA
MEKTMNLTVGNGDSTTELHKLIAKSNNIIITTHINPDGDALGSALAMYFYLKGKNKNPMVFISGEIPFNMEFLPGIEKVINYEKTPVHDDIINSDLVIVVDLNDLGRLRQLSESIMESKAPKAVIDHHTNPHDFADIYIVDTESSSTGQLIWQVFKSDPQFVLSKDIASLLYVAIMTDTGSFRFPRTTGDLHRVIADLIDGGADPVSLYEKVYNNNPFRTMKLLGEAFYGMELYSEGKLCLMKITAVMLERAGAVEDDIENFVEKTLSIRGVVLGILITEIKERNEIRMSFRSKGNYSARDIAVHFGGGGHFHAAGARVSGKKLEELAGEIIEVACLLFK